VPLSNVVELRVVQAPVAADEPDVEQVEEKPIEEVKRRGRPRKIIPS
jgi:hypothetical protein